MLQRYISQELTDLCSSKSGQIYATSYVGFSNVASRTGTNTTGTLTYDTLDHLTQWYEGSTNQEQYLYHASGQRMPRRFTNGNGTTILTYPSASRAPVQQCGQHPVEHLLLLPGRASLGFAGWRST